MKKRIAPFTFMLLREAGRPVRQLRVGHRLLAGLGAGAAVLLIALLVMSAVGLRSLAIDRDLAALEAERDQLLDRDLRRERLLVDLRRTLSETEEYQNWSRGLAGLEPLPDEHLAAGVGGPAPEGQGEDWDQNLESLLARTMVLRRSAEQVRASLQEREETLSRIPSIRPIVGGRMSSRYGRRLDPFTGRPAYHRGIDLSAPRGTPIMATAAGRVHKVRESRSGFGNQVVLDHGNGFRTRYAHCDKILVRQGQKVIRGELIATVGSSGHSTAPHLHYEVHREGKAANPNAYILSRDFIVD